MRSILLSAAIVVSSITAINVFAPFSQAYAEAPAATETPFIKKEKSISGSFSIVEHDGSKFIRLSDDFKASKGPDLKVFLSPQSVADVNGKTAGNNAVNLGALTSNKGTQEYLIPSDLDLSKFQSLLIHCEQYAVLWGGADL